MKKILVVLLFLIPSIIYSQSSIEAGLNGGGVFYLGDVNLKTPFRLTEPAAGVFLRYNFNTRWALKVNGGVGVLALNDEKSNSLYQQQRAHEYKTEFVDILAEFEFNFLPYRIGQKRFVEKYTPYFASGVGVLLLTNSAKITPFLPITLGLKVQLGTKMEIGISTSFRKTFTDKLDNLEENKYVEPPKKNGNNVVYNELWRKQKGLKYNSDWYVYTGVFLTYKIFQHSAVCKAYDF